MFLLKLADEYQMDELKTLCVDFMKSVINRENCLFLCSVADRYDLKDVIVLCAKKARALSMSDIIKSEYFESISPEAKLEIYTQRIEALEEIVDQRQSSAHLPQVYLQPFLNVRAWVRHLIKRASCGGPFAILEQSLNSISCAVLLGLPVAGRL